MARAYLAINPPDFSLSTTSASQWLIAEVKADVESFLSGSEVSCWSELKLNKVFGNLWSNSRKLRELSHGNVFAL